MPVLTAIYPVSIMLIVLALCEKIVGTGACMYRCTIYTTALISIVNALDQASVTLPLLTALICKLPMYSSSLGWLIPAFAVFILSAAAEKIIAKSKS